MFSSSLTLQKRECHPHNVCFAESSQSNLRIEVSRSVVQNSVLPPDYSYSDHNKVDSICKRLRVYLEQKDLVKYANAILTTYACQSPPDLESALRVLTKIKGQLIGIHATCI